MMENFVPELFAPRPVMLCILDGWGLSQNPVANAVTLGRTPTFDKLWSTSPHTQLSASGGDVGLQIRKAQHTVRSQVHDLVDLGA